MAEYSFPYPSVGGDRLYGAADWREYFKAFLTNGVFPVGGQLQVTAGEGMAVAVSDGKAWIEGGGYRNTAAFSLTIDPADGVLNRIDRIVVRYNVTDRAINLAVIKGTPASSPAAPAIVRSADYYDLCIAQISVPAGITEIASGHITDKRLDTSVCGIVSSLITPDTSGWYEGWEAEFQTWLASIQGLLEGDPATALAAAVATLQGEMDTAQTDIAELQRTIITSAATTYTISEAEDNTEYRLGTLTALTVTAFPAGTFECLIIFTAGATISVSLPAATKWNGAETPIWTAGKVYEISLKDGRAVAGEF